MPRPSAVLLAALCLLLTPRPAPAGENWPCWRGPRGDGTAEQCPDLPTSFLPDQNLVWKTDLPGEGHASPIIWENRIFTVSADPATEERLLLCLDRATGSLLWKQPVLKSPFESLHRL
ncbi:MAG: PQQ-binding-like beta-propeller repeat protein, partial [Verrucomicrobiales bacterium]